MSVQIVLNSIWSNPGNRGRRWARTLRAMEWQVAKRIVKKRRLITLANGARFLAYSDCVVSSSLIYADWPEHKELTFIRRQLRRGDVIVDVGANVGHISLLLSDIVGAEKIFAFEPTPVSFGRLIENWKANGWSTENLFQKAVGRSNGVVQIPDTASPETKNAITLADKNVASVQVPLVPLDDCRSHWLSQRLGLLKIDVEGLEGDVLAGARALLCEDRPRLVMFESLDGALASAIASVFEEARYEVFELEETGRPQFSGYTSQNLFAVPVEAVKEIIHHAETCTSR